MAEAAMTVLLESLPQMLLSCSDLNSGAEDELRLLGNEVELFRALLRDVANKSTKEEPLREMEREIGEVVYDAQDTIDSYLIEAAAAQSKTDLFRRRRQAPLTELVGSLAEAVLSFREDQVKPLLDRARIHFPSMLVVCDGSDPIREEMVDDAAKLLRQKISNLYVVLGSGDLISGAEEELQLLKNEIELLNLFLRDAANKSYEEEFFSLEVKRVVDDAQEMINHYLSKASAAKCRNGLYSSLEDEVRSIREDKVKPLLEKARIDFADMLLIGDGSRTTLEEPHQIKVNKVWSIGGDISVGRDFDQHDMINYYLKYDTEELGYVAIAGMAGLGKTTLARRVYQSQIIQYEYPTRIWVTVSQDFNKTDVFINILKEVSSRDMSKVSDDVLAMAIQRFLEKRKFFLVLDDVWTEKDLDAIRDALPKSNRSSRVLITSRSYSVGLHANSHRKKVDHHDYSVLDPYALSFLSEDSCWQLLQLEVFGGLYNCPIKLVEIGQRIARNCGGLPLKVVIIGGILVDQLLKRQSISALKKAWIEVFVYISKYLANEEWDFVEFGYNRLPDELRNLFLYLGLFPEDYEISTTTLIRLWIAEGFIQHQEGRSLEDIAEEKLHHLILRKLVIVDKVRSNGKVKSCRLHDTVRDFCIRKGMQVNLFRELKNSRKETFSLNTLPTHNMHRRLCLHSDLLEFFSSNPYISRVRSFSCSYKTESLLLPENTSKIPGLAFQLLRVMEIKPVRFTRFPLEVTQLFCLRYIVLSSNFKILPEVISKLRNLQSLIIHTSSRALIIKADIWKMIHLRHLQTNASIMLRKEPEIHSSQELQRLTNLSPENCTSSVFHRARCLKKLGIRGMLPILLDGEVGSRKFDLFDQLKDLENLKLINDVHMSSPSECRLSCLPPTNNFPQKLSSLTLSATFLSWEHMSVLGMLEKLEVLKLKDNAFVGECWEVADGSFPSLKVLKIGYTNLVSWKATHGHFPKLRSLALRNCEKLEALPQGLDNALSLQVIELLRPSKAVVASARKIEKERKKLVGNFTIKLSIYVPTE